MRGKLSRVRHMLFYTRITPAGAGKTIPLCRAKTQRQDHPRRCGENAPYHKGKVVPAGITPAGAGKTLGFSFPFDVYKDHPRRCGENVRVISSTLWVEGSPPQVRGKRKMATKTKTAERITPAGAGKTGINTATTSIYWDHPRRCGENGRHKVCNRAN